MRIQIEAGPEELRERGLALVRTLSTELAAYNPVLGVVAQALWKAETTAVGVVVFQGLRIAIENPIGSVRHWKDEASGAEGETVMQHPYGYIMGTKGSDGDGYDCFLGPDPFASMVYIVDQARPDLPIEHPLRSYDEQKALLGFTTPADAWAAYLAHYSDPKFLGSMSTMTVEEFRAKVAETAEPNHDGVVKAEVTASVAMPGTSSRVEPTAPRDCRGPTLPVAPVMMLAPEPLARGAFPAWMATESAPAGDRAVDGGTSGLNIALQVPQKNEAPYDPRQYREHLEAFLAQTPIGDVIKVPRSTYEFMTPPVMAIHPTTEIAAALPPPALPDQALLVHNRQVAEEYVAWRIANNEAAPAPVFAGAELANATTAAMRDVAYERTIEKSDLGPCTLRVRPNLTEPFEVKTPKDGDFVSFRTLSAACDHVWVLQKGYDSVAAWRSATGRQKVPSGGGWRFWGRGSDGAPKGLAGLTDLRGATPEGTT